MNEVRDLITKFLSENLLKVSKPARYIGDEYNSIRKEGKDLLNVVLSFPDVYEIGMSHYGLEILYKLVNSLNFARAERTFLPWIDMVEMMEKNDIPLFTLESKRPVNEFDVLGISLAYELSYTNVLKLLELSQIPIRAESRTNEPIVIAGGPVAFNCEPISQAFDIVYLGDGEVKLEDLLRLLYETRGMDRIERLKQVSKINGVYVPIFYKQAGRKIVPISPEFPRKVKRNVLTSLDGFLPTNRTISNVESVHDRAVIEISRGCTHGCRFCHAGFVYRPVRERSADEIAKIFEDMIRNTGYEEVSLLSLSSLDHSQIEEIIDKILPKTQKEVISISIPSTRMDAFSIEVVEKIASIRKTGLTFAPEAGSESMRDKINKNLKLQDILNTAMKAKQTGWQRIKLYFMVGFPEETEEDILEIGRLLKEIKRIGFSDVTASINLLIPKPHTAFQYAKLQKPEYMIYVKKLLGDFRKYGKIDINDGKKSYIEGILSRGDRKLFDVIEKVYRKGFFDEWSEFFSFERWIEELQALDLTEYEGPYTVKDDFPWDHLDSGVTKQFLWKEYQNYFSYQTTNDCRENCSYCGVCQMYGVANIIRNVRR